MVNRCIFVGRMVFQPKEFLSKNGKKFCCFTLAVQRPENLYRYIDYIEFTAYGEAYKEVMKVAAKGARYYVEGILQTYTKNIPPNETDERYEKKYKIIVEKIECLSTKQEVFEYLKKDYAISKAKEKKEKLAESESPLIPDNFDEIPF